MGKNPNRPPLRLYACLLLASVTTAGCAGLAQNNLEACTRLAPSGILPVAVERTQRFLGKVDESTARCRGGERAFIFARQPWVDWQNYWGTGDATTRAASSISGEGLLDPNVRGIGGALLDLEYQRVELLRFNLFDSSGTFPEYVRGRDGVAGPALKVWNTMRLPKQDPHFADVGGDGQQLCSGELIRFRNLTGICNDIRNPLMGSTGQLFARNVAFETTFPELGNDALAKNRHGQRLGPLQPDPQVISRKLFTRAQSQPDKCNDGRGLPGHAADASCDYKKAPFFNVLAAFWVQFMTHDWFSHLREGHNQPQLMSVGCRSEKVNNVEMPLTPEAAARLGCRVADRVDKGYVAQDGDPPTFIEQGHAYAARAFKTSQNTVTAWWDASQIYGYDELSRQRVKRDAADPAKLLLIPGRPVGAGERLGYLPQFDAGDPINPDWSGQEAAAFADNWSIGMSFFHNVFARNMTSSSPRFVHGRRRRRMRTAGCAIHGTRTP